MPITLPEDEETRRLISQLLDLLPRVIPENDPLLVFASGIKQQVVGLLAEGAPMFASGTAQRDLVFDRLTEAGIPVPTGILGFP